MPAHCAVIERPILTRAHHSAGSLLSNQNTHRTSAFEQGSTGCFSHAQYGVIFADPPWSFRTWSAKGSGRSAVSHYDCLSFEALAELPVSQLAAPDCALFLWATDPMLPRAFELIRAWGFEYKTVGFYWVKLNAKANAADDYFTGLGYWTRANPEQCLLATRGSPKRLAKDVRRLVVDPRREHSRKPYAVRERIERLVPGPYLELFARETKLGWDCWGDQTGLFDNGSVSTRRQPSHLTDQTQSGPQSALAQLSTPVASRDSARLIAN